MSMTDAYTETDTGAALAGAAAVVRCLPASDLTPSGPAAGPDAIATAIPAPGSKAVTANLAGAVGGSIVIVLSPELAAQVENGPIGPQELVAGLEPALTDATAAISSMIGDVRYEAPQALDAEIAVANAGNFESVVVVPLTSANAPVASLVLLINREVAAPAPVPMGATGAAFEPLSGGVGASGAVRAVELLNDVEMGVTAELGRTRMSVRDLLSMQPGSIVELDRAAGSPVDLLVNGTLVARGEVVVIDEEFGVRITEIIGYDAKGPQK
jgi:flagellar motor switch protein FliN/FliY